MEPMETKNISCSRRAFLATTGIAASALMLGAPRLFAHQNPEPTDEGVVAQFRRGGVDAKISIEKLRGNVSVLSGSGGNIGVLDGPDGKVVVDTGLVTSQSQIVAALASISDRPVKYVVDTHWHFDHTDGNAWLHGTGAMIIAHENVRKRMSESTRVEPWHHTFPPSPAEALPTLTLTSPQQRDAETGGNIHVNETPVRIDAYRPAHTDGDCIVTFVNANIIQFGDIFWNGHYPFIDYDTGGSINGTLRAVESAMQSVGAETILIPGHGPVANKSHLEKYYDTLTAIRDRVASLKKQGKSIDEVIAEKPTGQFDAEWGTFVIDGSTFTRLVYAGV